MTTMTQKHFNPKPIIMLNIDSLMPHALENVAQTGKAPALQFLMEKGHYIPQMVSSFPTMSVTIDSSLLTGTYADQHRIPGLHWFDTKNKQFVNYGTGLRETFRIGIRRTVHNMLYQLNHEHMSREVSTIYEDLAKQGMSSASINSFVYRGNSNQRIRVPRLLSTLTQFKDGIWQAEVPPTFSLGTFSKIRRFGLPTQVAAGNYKYVTKELRYLIRKRKLPHFTFCIFQDMDTRIHFKGPLYIKDIKKFDRQIQKLLNMYVTWEEALEKNIWMIIGDNGHAATGKKYRDVVIDLRHLLKKYRMARINRPVKRKDELAICVNQRMAFIYALHKNISLSSMAKQLKKDHRIDLIAWKEDEIIHVESGLRKGSLTYSPYGKYTDVYHQSWHIDGDFKVLDLKRLKDTFIDYGNYPDALARIFGALHSHEGRFIVVNAKPGCEFKAQSTPFHLSGAAHGSLHRQESHVPFVVAGTDKLPKHPRFVDLKPYILQLIQA